jgi:LCP family protein required for cell wall assembly
MQSRMSNDPGKRPEDRAGVPRATPKADPPYRVYRSGEPDPDSRPGSGQQPERPYTVYRSVPRMPRGLRGRGGRPVRPWRVVRWVVGLVVAWVLLAVVLFFISAQTHSGTLPAGAKSQLSGGGPILTSENTVLILGLDNRPTTGPGSKEGGLTSSQLSEKDANTDTIMLWRIGGGVSRRLSIPRDTLVNVPGLGESKINAAWSYGGPALALKVIKQLTGIRTINHLIVVDLANFPKFINDIGGVNVKTGRICSSISGGRADGGFTLDLKPGTHHLDGLEALLLARTRENSCNAAYDDLSREAAQQQIVNSIKSQLLTVHTFVHLPWAAWDAPGVIQTDMGGLSLMQLFLASEIGGSAPARLLHETGSTYDGEDVLMPSPANVASSVRRLMTGR